MDNISRTSKLLDHFDNKLLHLMPFNAFFVKLSELREDLLIEDLVEEFIVAEGLHVVENELAGFFHIKRAAVVLVISLPKVVDDGIRLVLFFLFV